MSWEWSHTTEAYQNAQEQVHALPRETLEIVYAEVFAAVAQEEPWKEHEFSEPLYNAALSRAKDLPDEAIADHIWRFAETKRTCTNGGWLAWICPWGCHTVPFDPVEQPA